MNLLEKVILRFKSLKFKKKVTSKLVANYIY